MTRSPVILGGWRPDPQEVDRLVSGLMFPKFGAGAPALSGTGAAKTVLLYKAFKEVNGGTYPDYPAQTIGDCVSQAFGHGVDLLAAVQIAQAGRAEVWTPTATEAIYGMARVDIGGLRGDNEDGAVGAWGAKAVSLIGTLSRAVVGPYDGNRSKEWGAKGVPREFAEKAGSHKVQTVSLVSTYDELQDALANGYPVAACSAQGFNLGRDGDGFCTPQGVWNHAMLIVGVRADAAPRRLLPPVVGARSPFRSQALDQPGNSFWVDRPVVEAMIRAGDTWSISRFDGYPKQDLPARWSYDGFA